MPARTAQPGNWSRAHPVPDRVACPDRCGPAADRHSSAPQNFSTPTRLPRPATLSSPCGASAYDAICIDSRDSWSLLLHRSASPSCGRSHSSREAGCTRGTGSDDPSPVRGPASALSACTGPPAARSHLRRHRPGAGCGGFEHVARDARRDRPVPVELAHRTRRLGRGSTVEPSTVRVDSHWRERLDWHGHLQMRKVRRSPALGVCRVLECKVGVGVAL